MNPLKNAPVVPVAYSGWGTTLEMESMGEISARTISSAMLARNSGVRILPTQVRILPGFRENHSTAPKNSSEKIQISHVPSSG